jgi:hypothetical protein
LVALNCTVRFIRSLIRNVRAMVAFMLNWFGPVIEFLPAFPHSPAAGATYASGFRNNPPVVSYNGAPV